MRYVQTAVYLVKENIEESNEWFSKEDFDM